MSLKWHSLNKIRWDNTVFTFSYGTDNLNDVVCCRLDLRYYVNDYPSVEVEVQLKKWELIQLEKFIPVFLKSKDRENLSHTVDDLKITADKYEIKLFKNDKHAAIDEGVAECFHASIPGFLYLFDLFKRKPTDPKPWILIDAFLYTMTIKFHTLPHRWDEEELAVLETGVLEQKRAKYMKQHKTKLWSIYWQNLGERLSVVLPCSHDEFIKRIDEFPQAVKQHHSENPKLIKSLNYLLYAFVCYKLDEWSMFY